ncbi:zinc ABC transporter substrate-binding protein [Candidatus Bathyarchaeota archaeon]|nr:zinc ABC transporter substrate-binding protein [Candidatus Bathyarchaeota archaeon]
MNKRQKLFVIATTVIVLTTVFATAFYSLQNKTENDKLKVVATFYPLAFFAQQIGGEQVTVKQLIPDNTEVHNWQPSFGDILALDEADVIIYNGASLDHWFEDDILPTIDSSNKIIIETTEGVNLLETEQENDDHEHEGPYDPHTWISPFIAKQQAQNIYESLVQKDPNNLDYYTERWQNLKAQFEELDNNYLSGLSTKAKEEIFVTHSAFGYLTDRYGFEQHGVIGISADEQPSASTYANLVEMMMEHETYVVYVDPVYADESAQTLRNELERLSGQDVQILKFYFMLGDMDGLDYFGQQEKNLENLKIGLEAS